MQFNVGFFLICSSRKYPFLPHGRENNASGSTNLTLYISLNVLVLQNPPPTDNFKPFCVGSVWKFSGAAQYIKSF